MDFIWNKITEWLKGVMIGGIMGNLQGLFDNVNNQVGTISTQVGTTPQAWNGSVFDMIQSLSNNVILPIAGVILAIVMTMELLQLVVDRNNMHDFETWIFFKWIFKTFCAVMIVTNTWDIIMGVFDVAQSVVNSAAGIISSDTSINLTEIVTDLEGRLQEMEIGPLLGLWFQTLFVGVTIQALSICIFVIVYGRMMEIYIVTSLAPIPMATMMNREWGQMGQNYLRSLFALGFQAFLIIVCVAIYAVLVRTITVEADVVAAIWTCIGYTVLLCFSLFKSGGVAKQIFNAH
ncbi:MAG: CD0415/CD1112 family protein [Eubacteriales bacterium]|nr:CD0415/CD1112 family protein [Eubacteriales bacterium]